MKKIIAYFIKYPVAVNIFIVGFLIFGYFGFQQLNSSIFPLSDPTIITVQVSFPGASPKEVEEGVVEKIERNLKGLEGIDRVTSISRENTGTVNIEVLTDFDINLVLDEVKNAVDKIPSFPLGSEPPVVETIKPTRPGISFVLVGENMPLSILKRTAQEIEDDFLRMDGISQITLSGFPEEEIEISVTEERLRSLDVTFDEISNAVSNANILVTGGSVKTSNEEYTIRAENKAKYANKLENIVVKYNEAGGKVLLRDVAETRNTFSESPDIIKFNGKTAIAIALTNTNSEDLIGSAEKARAYQKEF
ncbi:MAG: efflux RND transporter permease subunit, partial [Bacteroidota bacterium]